ncbi:MAG: hypothetical protein U0941_25570 [Planctomycetaceae bacterium]
MLFAKRVYLIAGIYGLIVLAPQYFLEVKNGQDFPPAITHPEYYYGFVGVGLAWQVAFLVISTDPTRYRPLMIPTVLEKISFGIAAAVLFTLGRLNPTMMVAGTIDMILGALFIASYVATRPRTGT